mmetsp:Transcript_1689/g.4746  ORF Transcript_1689/g.4746 Transcript_1689/m.4746 type:complete len:321 (+) Transcript_1689:125-1087(+)
MASVSEPYIETMILTRSDPPATSSGQRRSSRQFRVSYARRQQSRLHQRYRATVRQVAPRGAGGRAVDDDDGAADDTNTAADEEFTLLSACSRARFHPSSLPVSSESCDAGWPHAVPVDLSAQHCTPRDTRAAARGMRFQSLQCPASPSCSMPQQSERSMHKASHRANCQTRDRRRQKWDESSSSSSSHRQERPPSSSPPDGSLPRLALSAASQSCSGSDVASPTGMKRKLTRPDVSLASGRKDSRRGGGGRLRRGCNTSVASSPRARPPGVPRARPRLDSAKAKQSSSTRSSLRACGASLEKKCKKTPAMHDAPSSASLM